MKIDRQSRKKLLIPATIAMLTGALFPSPAQAATESSTPSSTAASPNSLPGNGGSDTDTPSGTYHCNSVFHSYGPVGTFTYQHKCGSTTGTWGWSLSDATISGSTGVASEKGMDWYKNGVKQGRNGPHNGVSPAYQFHGTFSGINDNSAIKFDDWVQFPISNGIRTVYIEGSIQNRP